MTRELIIEKEYHGVSPKLFLKKNIDVSFNTLMKLIKEKRITLNGKKIKAESKLSEGDIIKVWKDDINFRNEEIQENYDGVNLNMETIFENDDFLILNKRADVVVQGSQDHTKSLSLHLKFLKDNSKDNSNFQYFHVHRLDKDTSGVLVCAKNTIALRDLNELFRTRNVIKTYLCLVKGELNNSKGKIEINLARNVDGLKKKVKIVESEGKKTISNYEVKSLYKYKDEIFSLVELEIETGFMHQIRVHMKHLGHPIVCDFMYGNSYVNNLFKETLSRQFLHAHKIEFNYKNKDYKFEATMSDDLLATLEIMKKL